MNKKRLFLNNLFRALVYRNFRLFFAGQSVSLVGTWLQYVAMSWLVYRMTGSAFVLGVVGFFTQLPFFIFSPFAGILADRLDRRKILIATQLVAMTQAFILAYLTLTGSIQVWHIIFLGIVLGCVNALEIPARHSFVMDMVGGARYLLSNAVALHSFMFNLARLAGPAVAGFLIAAVGEGTCFLMNAVSFIAVIWSLLSMRMRRKKRAKNVTNMIKGMAEGAKYTFGYMPIRNILIMVAVMSMMGLSYTVVMPVFAAEVLRGGPMTLGMIMSAAGLGALGGTVFLAARKTAKGMDYSIPISAGVFGLSVMMISTTSGLFMAMALLVVEGFGIMVTMVSCNTLLQTISDDDKRGRVMSFYSMAFMGMSPIGCFIVGSAASMLGIRAALFLSGISCVGAAVFFAFKIPAIRAIVQPVYDRMRVDSATRDGIETVTELISAEE